MVRRDARTIFVRACTILRLNLPCGVFGVDYKKYMCLVCGWIYDEEAGCPDDGIAPGTRWADIPMNWVCPDCGARKEDFEMIEVA